MSSWLLMGLPGVAYLSGIADAAWTAIGLAIGTYINWLIVAKRIRIYSYKAKNSITIPDFFTNRYRDQDKKNILMLVAAAVIIIFFIPYTASGFSACGKLFASLFGVNYQLAMVVSAVIIVLYTCLGGFSAASTTDFIQSIVMSIALIIVVVFGVNVAGGLNAVSANASALPGYLSMTAMYDAVGGTATKYGLITIISTMAWGLGYFGMPHILLRFMAIEDEKKLPMARRVGSIWVVISMAVAIFIGIVGYSMSKVGAVPVLT
jgi:sodium/proline symporter